MEPFVPEPTERIARSGTGPSTVGLNSDNSISFMGNFKASALKRHLPLLVMAALMVILVILFSTQNHSIKQLEEKILTLSTLQKTEIASPKLLLDKVDEEVKNLPEDAVSRVSTLESTVADNVTELDTVRQMLAETLSQLDEDLEGSLTGKFKQNLTSIDAIEVQLAGFQEVVKAQKTAAVSLKKNTIELQKLIKQQLANNAELTALQQSAKESSTRLSTVEGGLVSTKTQLTNQLETSISPVSRQIVSLKTALEGAVARLLTMEGDFVQSGDALKDELEQKFAAIQTNLNTLEGDLVQSGNALKDELEQKFAAIQTNLNTMEGDLVQSRDVLNVELEQKLAALQVNLNELDSKLGGSLTAIESDILRTNRVLNTEVSKKISVLETNLTKTDRQLRASLKQNSDETLLRLSTVEVGLMNAKGQLATLDADVTSAGNSVNNGFVQVEETKKAFDSRMQSTLSRYDARLEQLKTENIDMGTQYEASQQAIERLREQQGSSQSQLNSLAASAFVDSAFVSGSILPIKQQINGLSEKLESSLSLITAQKNTINQLRLQMDTLPSTPSSSSAGDAAVLSIQTQLTTDIAATNTRLSVLKKELAGLKASPNKRSGASASNVSSVSPGDMDRLRSQLTNLSARVDRSLDKISTQDMQLNSWQKEIENRVISSATELQNMIAESSQSGSDDGQAIKVLKEMLVLLKKQHPYTKFPKIE